MALGEAYCFYVNHSGVIRDALAKVKQNLTERARKTMVLELVSKLV